MSSSLAGGLLILGIVLIFAAWRSMISGFFGRGVVLLLVAIAILGSTARGLEAPTTAPTPATSTAPTGR